MTVIDYEQTEARGMQAGRVPALYRFKSAVLDVRGPSIPPSERATGCDVSKWNDGVNFVTMKNAGASFCFMKATQGTAWYDNYFNAHRTAIAGVLPFSPYHYLTNADGVTQANNFCNVVGDNYGALPPVVDVELASVASSIVKAYCQRVYALLGMYPMIYTSSYFWSLVTGATDKAWVSSHCQLWVAHWGTDSPILPSGWTNYSVHQYSADGNGLGVTYGAPPPPAADDDMDLNRCRLSWLYQYAPPADWQHALVDWARGLGYTGPGPDG